MKSRSAVDSLVAMTVLATACGTDKGPAGPAGPRQTQAPSVTITPAVLDTLFFRAAVRFTAVARGAQGNQVDDTLIHWATSNPSAWLFQSNSGLSTSASGSAVLLYPNADGSSVITASAGVASATVTVSARQKVAAIAITPSPILRDAASGGFAYLRVDAVDSHGSRYYFSARRLTLVSSDSMVAVPELDEECIDLNCAWYAALVFGLTPGFATITVSLPTVDGTVTATAKAVNTVP